MRTIATLVMFILVCCGVPESGTSPDVVVPENNAVTCDCDVQILDVFAPNCLLAGGTSHDGYCWAERAESVCYPAGTTNLDAFCQTSSIGVISVLNLFTGACPLGHVCPASFCHSTITVCHASQNRHERSCEQPCPAIALQLTPSGSPTNVTTATYVPAPLSCNGQDTSLICEVGRRY